MSIKPKKEGGLFGMGGGLMDIVGNLGQFEEYGKALVEFQAHVKASLSRIEAEQKRQTVILESIRAEFDLVKEGT